ncbi:hypothetical protein ACLUEY_16990 [Vreelandella aquamarina]
MANPVMSYAINREADCNTDDGITHRQAVGDVAGMACLATQITCF